MIDKWKPGLDFRKEEIRGTRNNSRQLFANGGEEAVLGF